MDDQPKALSDALAAARAQAISLQRKLSGVPAASALATQPAAPARRIKTLDDVIEDALVANAWLKVSAMAFTIGKDTTTPLKSLIVRMRLSDATIYAGLRYEPGPGHKARYFRSRNGVVDDRSGQSWAELISQAMGADPRCRGDYDCADVLFYVTEDIRAQAKKGQAPPVLLERGKTIAWTTPITGFKDFTAFARKVAGAGIAQDAWIEVEIEHEAREDGAGNKFGGLVFGVFAAVDGPDVEGP